MSVLFSDFGYGLGNLVLGRFDAAAAQLMGDRLAAIDPWARLGIGAGLLARVFVQAQDCTHRFVVRRDAVPLAAISLRHPFLYGPYIELLAVLPEAQGQGVGGRLLDWVGEETRLAGGRNVWVAASSFNAEALAFYRRHGFAEVGPMPDLVRPGFTELMLRRQL